MCGLVGIMGRPSYKLVKVFNTLLQIDVIRGSHSTGICTIEEKDSHWTTLKDACLPQELMEDRYYIKNVDSQKGYNNIKCLMGHNRWATKGAINGKNAHPFVKEHIVLMHNGTIQNTYELKDYNDDKDRKLKYDTDSELVCHKIAEKGIEWTWKHIDGAAALAFWDAKNNSLNLIRNKERPLYFAFTKDREYLIYASESWMIKGVCERCNLEIKEHVWSMNPDYMFTFRWNKKKKIVTSTEKKLNPFVKPYYSIQEIYGKRSGDNQVFQETASFHNKKDDEKLQWTGARLKNISEEEFKKKYDRCIFCNESVENEYNECVLIDDETAVCNSCATVAELENIRILH